MRGCSKCNRTCCIIHLTPDNFNEANFSLLIVSILCLTCTNIALFFICITLAYLFCQGWILFFSNLMMFLTNAFLTPSNKSFTKMTWQMPDYAKKLSKIRSAEYILAFICTVIFVISTVFTIGKVRNFPEGDMSLECSITVSLYVVFGLAYCIISFIWVSTTKQSHKYLLTKELINILPQHKKDELNHWLQETIDAIPNNDRITLNGIEYIPTSKLYPIPEWIENELGNNPGGIAENVEQGQGGQEIALMDAGNGDIFANIDHNIDIGEHIFIGGEINDNFILNGENHIQE